MSSTSDSNGSSDYSDSDIDLELDYAHTDNNNNSNHHHYNHHNNNNNNKSNKNSPHSNDQGEKFEECKERAFFTNTKFLERQIKALKDRLDEEYLAEVKKYEIQRDQRIQQADVFRRYQMDCVTKRLQRERDIIDEDIIKAKETALAETLTQLQERKRQLEEERNVNDLTAEYSDYRPPSSLRKSARQVNPPGAKAKARTGRKQTPTFLPQLQALLALDELEVSSDIESLIRPTTTITKKGTPRRKN